MTRADEPFREGSAARRGGMDQTRKVVAAQGAYYVATGVAPFVSRRAFEAVTGPKREWWLVEAVGTLVTSVGAGLLGAAARDRVTPELLTIAVGCAAGLATIDIVYVARRRIAPTYLADAAVELALLAAASVATRGARGYGPASRPGAARLDRVRSRSRPPGGSGTSVRRGRKRAEFLPRFASRSRRT